MAPEAAAGLLTSNIWGAFDVKGLYAAVARGAAQALRADWGDVYEISYSDGGLWTARRLGAPIEAGGAKDLRAAIRADHALRRYYAVPRHRCPGSAR